MANKWIRISTLLNYRKNINTNPPIGDGGLWWDQGLCQFTDPEDVDSLVSYSMYVRTWLIQSYYTIKFKGLSGNLTQVDGPKTLCHKPTVLYIRGWELNLRKLPDQHWESNPQPSEQLQPMTIKTSASTETTTLFVNRMSSLTNSDHRYSFLSLRAASSKWRRDFYLILTSRLYVSLIHFSILETMVRNRLFVYKYSAAIHYIYYLTHGYLPSTAATTNVVHHHDFDLHFHGHKFWNVNIWKTVKNREKYTGMSFIQIDICQRLGLLLMLYSMTLTFIFMINNFLSVDNTALLVYRVR